MKKLKSIKFYNFIIIAGHITLNVNFFDEYGKLIVMDFSNYLSSTTTTKCETDKYLITASSSLDTANHNLLQAFHTANVNNTLNINRIGRAWVQYPTGQPSSDQFIKFEFKQPTVISNIHIIHSYCSGVGFDTCDIDIEYDDGSIITKNFISSGKTNKYSLSAVLNGSYDQEDFDAQFAFLDGYDKYVKNFTDDIGLVETDNNNCFRNINSDVKTLKCLYTKPTDTEIKFLISFDKKSTWKMYDGSSWNVISDVSESNILLNGSDIEAINNLDNATLKAGGFIGDMDFKIALHTNDKFKTPAISKIYVEYK